MSSPLCARTGLYKPQPAASLIPLVGSKAIVGVSIVGTGAGLHTFIKHREMGSCTRPIDR